MEYLLTRVWSTENGWVIFLCTLEILNKNVRGIPWKRSHWKISPLITYSLPGKVLGGRMFSSILTLSNTIAGTNINTGGENHPELWMLFASFMAPGGNVNT